MPGSTRREVIATGVGVVTAVGQGKAAFTDALMQGHGAFAVMQRPGRQLPRAGTAPQPAPGSPGETRFLGAELVPLTLPAALTPARRRTASLSAQAAITCLHEAWQEAQLGDVDPVRIGLVVGGSNVQQRELVATHDAYRNRLHYLRPSYSLSFMDSDLCGLCTELFGIRGLAFTAGGASASGQLAVLQAHQLLQSDCIDVCIAIGALMDLSYWECQGFRAIGAMGSDRFADRPALACRPFDRDRDGFIYGECSAAIVLERADRPGRTGVAPYARLLGGAIRMDANRNADPSLDGEISAIRGALEHAGVPAASIDYVNPHGTGSPRGDETEVEALHRTGLSHAYINATKSITGHGLSAAGAVEIAATLLQMRTGHVHPSPNLDNPMDDRCNWVQHAAIPHQIHRAVKLSMGFGGLNTALCLEAIR
jgi:malonyl-ACP decarboxylase